MKIGVQWPYLFRYTKELLYHQLSLSSTRSIRLNLGTHGMNTANICWIALVAGSHLQHLQSVFNTVDLLGTQMQKTAYAVFLLGDSENADFVRNHWTPPVVSIFKIPVIKNSYHFCSYNSHDN